MPSDTTNHCPGCAENEHNTSLAITTLADIREALGVGHKPMLSDLPGIVRQAAADNAALRDLAKRMHATIKVLHGWVPTSESGEAKINALLAEGAKVLGGDNG